MAYNKAPTPIPEDEENYESIIREFEPQPRRPTPVRGAGTRKTKAFQGYSLEELLDYEREFKEAGEIAWDEISDDEEDVRRSGRYVELR
jgi:hypothetical protein